MSHQLLETRNEMAFVTYHLVKGKRGVSTLWAFENESNGKVFPYIYRSGIKVAMNRNDIVACHEASYGMFLDYALGGVVID
jgi:hypothetical protein